MIVPRSIKYQDCLAYKTYTCTCMSIGYVATVRIAHYVSVLEFFLTEQKKKRLCMVTTIIILGRMESIKLHMYSTRCCIHALYNYVHVIVIRS